MVRLIAGGFKILLCLILTLMNLKYNIALSLLLGVLIGAYLSNHFFSSPQQVNQIRLEEILSIKELHLVKHTYNDLFFLHRKNDSHKSIRAIVQVPVSITSYLNLKEIKLIKENDSIKKVILPIARLNRPDYQLDHMIIRKTRSFQVHAGADLYPTVGNYLKATLVQRMDTICTIAITNQILQQAEVEGKEYIEGLLKAVGRSDIIVSFGDHTKDMEIIALQRAYRFDYKNFVSDDTTLYKVKQLSLGWIQIK